MNVDIHDLVIEGIGLIAREQLTRLASHYGLDRAELETQILIVATAELLSLIPSAEKQSDAETFRDRLANHRAAINQCVEKALETVAEVRNHQEAMARCLQKLQQIILQQSSPSAGGRH